MPGEEINTVNIDATNIDVTMEKEVKRVIFLNALVPPSYRGLIYVEPTTWEKVKKIVEEAKKTEVPVKSYIGHQSTSQLLEKQLGINIPYNRDLYQPQPGDLAIVARLRGRPQGEQSNIKPEDFEIYFVFYL